MARPTTYIYTAKSGNFFELPVKVTEDDLVFTYSIVEDKVRGRLLREVTTKCNFLIGHTHALLGDSIKDMTVIITVDINAHCRGQHDEWEKLYNDA